MSEYDEYNDNVEDNSTYYHDDEGNAHTDPDEMKSDLQLDAEENMASLEDSLNEEEGDYDEEDEEE